MSAFPWMYAMSFFDGSGGGTRPSGLGDRREYTYSIWLSGSKDPPAQTEPPPFDPSTIVAIGPSARLTTGGVKSGPILYFEMIWSARSCSSGVKSMTSSGRKPWRS